MPTLAEIRRDAVRTAESLRDYDITGNKDEQVTITKLGFEDFTRVKVIAFGEKAKELTGQEVVKEVEFKAEFWSQGVGLIEIGVKRTDSSTLIHCGAGVDFNSHKPWLVSDWRVEDPAHPVNVLAKRIIDGVSGQISRSQEADSRNGGKILDTHRNGKVGMLRLVG